MEGFDKCLAGFSGPVRSIQHNAALAQGLAPAEKAGLAWPTFPGLWIVVVVVGFICGLWDLISSQFNAF